MSPQPQHVSSQAPPKTYRIEQEPPAPPVASPAADTSAGFRIDILRLRPLKWLVTRRWFQFSLVLPNLLVFLVFLVAGVFGSPVGNRNIIIIFVWIFWWFL